MELLQLKCRACGSTEHLYLDNDNNTAFEFMEWSELTECVPDLNERIWERSSTAPAVGEKRLVKVAYPFSYRCNDRFDVLFQPASAALNGWGSADEINSSAIISCRFIRVLCCDEYSAWIEVEAIRVVSLKQLAAMSPVSEISYDKLQQTYTDIERFSEWTLCGWSAQGDVGDWELFYTDSNNRLHSVLFSHWDMCLSSITYCDIH